MVYVISKDGQPLVPTKRHGKVRRLLQSGQAKVVRRCPFTVQLLYESETHTQDISLGVDAGSKVIGLSATTEKEELYAAEVELRSDITELLSTRRELRRSRRNRKTRYRKVGFDNRVHAKQKGWLAPSIEAKIGTHLKAVSDVHRILPITKIAVETASFDTQMLRAKEFGKPLPEGTDYQQGEQLYFWNVREYVLFRDGHVCQCCKGKSKDKILNVHHLESRKIGGNAPSNLITLCESCHKAYHQGKITLPESAKRGLKYNDAVFMGIMRWAFYERLKQAYPNVKMTFGYVTKNARITHDLPKEHHVDARCISGNPKAEPLDCYYAQKKVRCHNRKLHKMTILKGGYRKENQAPKYVKGFQLFDKVRFNGKECFIFGRRSSGSFDIRLLDGTKVNAGVSSKKLLLLEKRKTLLTERRTTVSSPCLKARVSTAGN